MQKDLFTKEELNHGEWLFSGDCNFYRPAGKVADIPPDTLPEIAFAGRSNVGKSSIINALTKRKALARTSNTPGRTREINFFSLREKLMLVDLPGYGYASVSKKMSSSWNKLIISYLKGRASLKRVCLLIDARRGLKDSDIEIMKILDDAAVIYQIVLTKADKVKKSEIEAIIDYINNKSIAHPALHPEVITTSSINLDGINMLRAELAKFAG